MKNYSSKEILDTLVPDPNFDINQFHQMQNEIEKEMEEFDRQQILKRAQAIRDLANFVITT